MKICSACNRELPREQFSKKQWQLKQYRRCKECVAEHREAEIDAAAPNNVAPLPSSVDSETALCWADDEALFKQPPPREDCPICLMTLPIVERAYKSCCGKVICFGCIFAHTMEDHQIVCPFCATPGTSSDKEMIERMKRRVEADDANAIHQLACYYRDGAKGLPQNYNKAIELWLWSGELGNADSYNNIAGAYFNGDGVEKDNTKARYYGELAAMKGNVAARHNLGLVELKAGNVNRALKHYMIAAGDGYDKSVSQIRQFFVNGHATKDDFERALRANKEAKDEVQSDQRDIAAKFYVGRR